MTQDNLTLEEPVSEPSIQSPAYDGADHGGRRGFRFRGLFQRPLYVVTGLVVVLLVIFLIVRGTQSKNSAHYSTAPAAYNDINASIQETGTVNPVDQVQVGTQVSGTISQLNVDYNSIVRKGQILARLDPTSFQAAALQAHATLDAARSQAAASESTINQNAAAAANSVANAQQLRANIAAAQANVQKAAAQEHLSSVTVSRDRSLLRQGFISQSQFDTDQATERSNLQALSAAQAALVAAQQQAVGGAAQVMGARAQITTSQNQAGSAQAQVEVAAAQAQQADYNLSRTVITSPIDGIVVSRSVSVGQTVAASLQTPTLFVIASSLKDMEVDVSVDEADVGQLRQGQSADITVPAYPNVTFHGIVHQVRVNPTTVQNVVTYDAVVYVHDEQQRLKPGMTANISINVLQRHHVLTVPLAALLYHPSFNRSGGGGGSRTGGGGGFSVATTSQTQTAGGGSVNQVSSAPGSTVRLWVLRAKRPVPVKVTIGYSDGNNVEITGGSLQAGDQVITGESRATSAPTMPPGFPGGFGGGRG